VGTLPLKMSSPRGFVEGGIGAKGTRRFSGEEGDCRPVEGFEARRGEEEKRREMIERGEYEGDVRVFRCTL
jgi:hypothetical protein